MTKEAMAQEVKKQVTNSVGMAFVFIPDGEFMMGSGDDDPRAYDVEKLQHKVLLTKPFYMSQTEITQAQWEKVMGYNPFKLPRSNAFYHLPGMEERLTQPDHPATVSWYDAQEFISRLNQLESTERYRLPTEAEWEYAARAGTSTAYSFGDDKNLLSEYAWYGEDFSTGGSHSVASKKPNPWGLYDVHGNVWEWVEDWYSPSYDKEPQRDPKGPQSGTDKAVRGGSWHVTATSWRSAFRKPYNPNYRGISIGFRIVMDTES